MTVSVLDHMEFGVYVDVSGKSNPGIPTPSP